MTPTALVVSGLFTGLALIAAVGAQNAFLLRQGLRRQHVAPLVALCATSDIVLIGGAVVGMGALIEQVPGFMTVARVGGAAFVIGYGLLAAWRARRPGPVAQLGSGTQAGLGRALLAMAALTWLNPHLYLDVVILGTIANGHGEVGRWWYYTGLVGASIVWFSALGFGSARLAPAFTRPRAWQVLDGLIAVVMVAIGLTLLLA